jgi:adenylate cyclase class 2
VATGGVEVEVKLAIQDAGAVRRALRRLGFTRTGREHEYDTLFDTPGLALRQGRCLLRLRRHGRNWLLTYKGPPETGGRYKSRPEIETAVADGRRLLEILGYLGYRPAFIYEKMRTNFRPTRGQGVASLDVTPIGTYLELEGPRPWIDRTARALGFSSQDYITQSYAALYYAHCQERGIEPGNMVFGCRNQKAATDSADFSDSKSV